MNLLGNNIFGMKKQQLAIIIIKKKNVTIFENMNKLLLNNQYSS